MSPQEIDEFRTAAARNILVGSRANAAVILRQCLIVLPDTTRIQNRRDLELQGTLGEQILSFFRLYKNLDSIPQGLLSYFFQSFPLHVIIEELRVLKDDQLIEQAPYDERWRWHYRLRQQS